MGTPVLGGRYSHTHTIDRGPQDLMPPCPNTTWPYALTYSTPFSPAAWPVSTSRHRS